MKNTTSVNVVLARIARQLKKEGVSSKLIAEVVQNAKGIKTTPCPRIGKDVTLRIRNLLPRVGSSVKLFRTKTGFKVYDKASISSLSKTCSKHKPWKKKTTVKTNASIGSALKTFTPKVAELKAAWVNPILSNKDIAEKFGYSQAYIRLAAKGLGPLHGIGGKGNDWWHEACLS